MAVRNLTTETLPNISLVGSVGRSRTDVAASFEIPPSGPLAPGQTWEHEVRVTLPAPVLDRFLWRVIASGAGGPVEAESSTNALPIGFVVLVSVLAADLAAIAWRTPARRRRRRARSAELGVRRGSAAKVPLVAGPLVAGPPTGPRCGRRRRHWAIAALGVPRRHRRFARGSPSLQESPHAGRRFAAG